MRQKGRTAFQRLSEQNHTAFCSVVLLRKPLKGCSTFLLHTVFGSLSGGVVNTGQKKNSRLSKTKTRNCLSNGKHHLKTQRLFAVHIRQQQLRIQKCTFFWLNPPRHTKGGLLFPTGWLTSKPPLMDTCGHLRMFVVSGHLYQPLPLSQPCGLKVKIKDGFGTRPPTFKVLG